MLDVTVITLQTTVYCYYDNIFSHILIHKSSPQLYSGPVSFLDLADSWNMIGFFINSVCDVTDVFLSVI